MSGHSKWSSIKHKKALTDAKCGQMFSKLSRNITLTARKNTDPKTNPALASAIERAKDVNMPNDNIERAIKKVLDKNTAQLEEILIEAIGPGGVAIRATGVTDNRNRTITEIKTLLTRHNTKMVPPGSITWMFHTPMPVEDKARQQLEQLFEALDNHDDIDGVDSNLVDEPTQP